MQAPGWQPQQQPPGWQAQQQAQQVHQAWQSQPTANSLGGGGGDDGDDDGDEPTASTRKGNCFRCGFAFFVLLATVAAMQIAWQQQVVFAKPYEIYRLQKMLADIMPNSVPVAAPTKQLLSKQPKPVFRISASIFYIYVSNLCDPLGETFDSIVNKEACQEKMRLFCEDLRDRTPDEMHAEKDYTMCLTSVSDRDGITIPLLAGPNDALWSTPEKAATLTPKSPTNIMELEAELESELEIQDADKNVDFCKVVAHCDKLEKMRPWNYGMLAVMCLLVCILVVAMAFMTASVVWPTSNCAKYGCSAFGLAVPFLLGAVILYVYIDKKFPVQDLVHTEALFYFILPYSGSKDDPATHAASLAEVVAVSLPGAGLAGLDAAQPLAASEAKDSAALGETTVLSVYSGGHFGRMERRWGSAAGRLEAQGAFAPLVPPSSLAMTHAESLDTAVDGNHLSLGGSSRIPSSRWQAALLKITESFLWGLANNDLSDFFSVLGKSLDRAWKLADVVFANWMRYLGASIMNGPQVGNKLLDGLTVGFQEFIQMDSFNETCNKTGHYCELVGFSADQAAQQAEFIQLKENAELTTQGVHDLLKSASGVIQLTKAVWDEVAQPFTRTIQRIVDIFKDKGQAMKVAMDMASDERTLADLRLLFNRIFVGLPEIVIRVLKVCRRLYDFASGLKGFFERTTRAWLRVSELLRKVAQKAPYAAATLVFPIQNKLATLRTNLLESSKYWANNTLTEMEAALETPTTAASLLQGGIEGPNFLTLIEPFLAGRISGIGFRVGTIFLHKLEFMESSVGLRTRKELAVCSLQMPSACTHFGTGFFGASFLVLTLAIASAGFLCGKW